MSDAKKPREFWIFKGSSDFCSELFMKDDFIFAKAKPCGFYDIVQTKDTVDGGIHVIEYSAYEQLQKENKELKLQLLDRTEKYSIAIDKGVDLLSFKIKKLTQALKVAEDVLEFYKEQALIDDQGASFYCDAEEALAEIKKLKDEI